MSELLSRNGDSENLNLGLDFLDISQKLNLDLNLRPQNLYNLTYYKICKIYETLID